MVCGVLGHGMLRRYDWIRRDGALSSGGRGGHKFVEHRYLEASLGDCFSRPRRLNSGEGSDWGYRALKTGPSSARR